MFLQAITSSDFLCISDWKWVCTRGCGDVKMGRGRRANLNGLTFDVDIIIELGTLTIGF